MYIIYVCNKLFVICVEAAKFALVFTQVPNAKVTFQVNTNANVTINCTLELTIYKKKST